MIVVDTNVIAYLILPGDHTAAARAALRKDPEWAAPLLWRSEFRSILSLYIRRKLLSLQDALPFMQEAESLMHGGEYGVVSTRVLQLAADSSCTAYDCEFVALAQELQVPLVTTDRQVLSAFPKVAVSLSAFASKS